jgi:hypothetical protein
MIKPKVKPDKEDPNKKAAQTTASILRLQKDIKLFNDHVQ